MLGTGPAKKLLLPAVVESRSNSKGQELARGWTGVRRKSKCAAFHSFSRAGARFQTASCQEAAQQRGTSVAAKQGNRNVHLKAPPRGPELGPAPTRPPRTGAAAGWRGSRDLSYCSWASLVQEANYRKIILKRSSGINAFHHLLRR